MANKAPASLVAPPRTISDIAAILDQQKPDAARIAELTATADAAVSKGLKGLELADFYYKRGQARSLLGRSDDAVADAELAVSNGQGSDYKNVGSRYEQFDASASRGRPAQASKCIAVQTDGRLCYARQGKVVWPESRAHGWLYQKR
ncbi:MAG TPA: hypothetical protein VK577_19440 [Bradyrhizobium sp.]|nr:hypothetical protein [Bradyrhizobium sp.]